MYKNILKKKYFKFFSIAMYVFFFVGAAAVISTETTFAQNSSSTQAQWVQEKAEATSLFASCLNPLSASFSGCIGAAVNGVLSWFFYFIYYAFVYPLSLIASFVFDLTVYVSVVKFRDNFSELQLGGVGTIVSGGANVGFIYYLWGIVRDILNIIIFIMIIYHAVRSMFDGFEGTKSKFISLLVFSIITNFSLLFVKLAIDISNILTLQAYSLGVKPSGTDTLTAFRTSSGNEPANYGEFIRNSVDMDRLVTSSPAPELAKTEIENMQNLFLFQLGRIITLVGVIYLLLFMTGLLLARALSFLFAMILSPLLAADIFFTMIAKNNPLVDDIRNGISGITKKIKGDFYDGLIKGPLLMFFIFLIGLFAESIMGSTLMNTMNSTFSGSAPSNVPGVIGQNLFVFFKFALFFFLTKKVLELLQSISFGGKMLNSFGNVVLGRSLGGLSSIGGYAGRRVLGGAFSNSKFREKKMEQFRGMAMSDSAIKRTVGQFGIKSLKTIKGGSFDARNSKTTAKLGTLINNVATGTGIKVENTGTAITKSFEDLKEEKIKEAADRRKAYIEAAQEGVVVIQKDKDEIAANTKVDLGGEKVNAEQIDKAIKSALSQQNPDGSFKEGAKVMLNNKELSGSALDIFKKDSFNNSEADNALSRANKEAEKKIAEKAAEKKKETEKIIREKIAQGKGPTFLKEDFGSVDAIFNENVLGRDIQNEIQNKERGDAMESSQKKIKDKAKETPKKYSLISSARSDLKNLKEKLESAIPNLTGADADTANKQLDSIKKVLENEIIKDSKPNASLDDQVKRVEGFAKDKDLQSLISKIKSESASLFETHFDSSEDSYKSKLKVFKEEKEKNESQLDYLKDKLMATGGDGGVSGKLKVLDNKSNIAGQMRSIKEKIKAADNEIKKLESLSSFASTARSKAESFNSTLENLYNPPAAPKTDGSK